VALLVFGTLLRFERLGPDATEGRAVNLLSKCLQDIRLDVPV
jgi:hypothetical protein